MHVSIERGEQYNFTCRNSEEAERGIVQLLWGMFGSVIMHQYSDEFRFMKLLE